MEEFYAEKKILITGAAGTVGREVVRQFGRMQPAELRLMDNNESETFFLSEEYPQDNVHCFIGDVRDAEKLKKLAEGVDVIVHCAAFKHVILSEYNPFDVVQTNIIGVENVIRAAEAAGVSNVLFTSSDKAVNPTNVMGTSKLMGERLITAANTLSGKSRTVLSSTRFGNVLGSRGSVVPLFMKQIRGGGPVTLTDERMTRFVMTTQEAARLVLESVVLSRGGEVFVTKMPVISIVDLAEVMIEMLAPGYGHKPGDIQIKVVGAKPGEKLYEELLSQEETARSLELVSTFVVLPAFKALYHSIDYTYPDVLSESVDKPYVSSTENKFSKKQLAAYLSTNRVFEGVEDPTLGGAA